jgi:hypothetical protein
MLSHQHSAVSDNAHLAPRRSTSSATALSLVKGVKSPHFPATFF